MSNLSVIIPTHKRATILRMCLEHLAAQTIAENIEVIVVSDGHDLPTSGMFAEMDNGQWKTDNGKTLQVCYEEVPKSQQGIARNRGVVMANSPMCLFIGDDIFLEPTACEKHLSTHSQLSTIHCPFTVLGFTTWDPSVGITPVMRWLEQSGWQFGYPKIAQFVHKQIPSNLQHQFTYTSNISLPTELAKKHPFREDISLYGWEDIEWGMRLRDAGIPLVYEPDAKALHHHRVTKEQSLKRMKTLGTSVVHLSKIEPKLDRLPRGIKRIAYECAALLPTMVGRHRRAFLRGVRSVR